MKRKVASRKLKRKCFSCGCNFKKGDVYYIDRKVFAYLDGVFAHEYTYCAKCKYKLEEHFRRFERFKPHCHHPIINTVWTPISGEEWRYEPDHDECLICGAWL
ncbi:hypothetical protein ABE402_05910 [Bacillus smithii]|uniref:hypothetical protein n=1 Tax=Bacillus smithii TaxID=1479 RepID=UPI003D20D32E